MEHSITADREVLYQAVSQLIVKHKDFLDIISFLSYVIAECGIMSDTEKVRTKGLEMIQAALADCAIDVKIWLLPTLQDK